MNKTDIEKIEERWRGRDVEGRRTLKGEERWKKRNG